MIKRSDLIIVPEKRYHYTRDGWNLLYDPVNVNWIRLNNDGMKIINAIENYKYIDGITANLAKEYTDKPLADIRKVVEGFIESLVAAEFLHLNEYKKQEFNFPIPTVPYEIYFFMTYRCNLECKYCYDITDRATLLKESNKNSISPLSIDEYKELVQAARHTGIKTCVLTGGEPLLNPITLELGDYIAKQGLEAELITNGTLVNEANAAAIAGNFNTVSISLDSLNRETHEKGRGEGTFDKIVESIKLLKAHNASIRVNSVITRTNVKEILDTRIWAYDELKCDTYTPTLYNPGSKAPEVYGRFMPEIQDLLKEQQRIREHFKDKPGVAFTPARIRCNCGIGTNNISISPYGFVFPCHALHKPELKCGNVREQNLEQILVESKSLQEMRHIHVNDVEFCRECDFKYLCGGGCLAINYNVYNDFFVKDKFYCEYIKQEHIERMWTYTTQNIKNQEPIGSKK